MINVIYEDASYGIVKQAKRRCFYDKEQFLQLLRQKENGKELFDFVNQFSKEYALFWYYLYVGKIAPDDFEVERKKWLNAGWEFFDEREMQELFDSMVNTTNKIITAAQSGETICFWLDETPGAICCFYYLMFKLQGINCKVLCLRINRNFYQDKEVYFWSGLNSEDVLAAIDKIEVLSLEERVAYAAEWQRLQTENAELRILQNGKIVSVPVEYFDEQIVALMPKTKSGKFSQRSWEFKCLEKIDARLGCFFYAYRIREMEKMGLIKLIKDCTGPQDFGERTYMKVK